MDVWLMGSTLKTKRQDYVYINCLLDSDTINDTVVVYFRGYDMISDTVKCRAVPDLEFC